MRVNFRVSILLASLLSLSVFGQDEPPVPLPPEAVPNLKRFRVTLTETNVAKQKLWQELTRSASKSLGMPIQLSFAKDEADAARRLARKRAEFALVLPERYVREVGMKTGVASLAVLRRDREFGFRVALMVRPDSEFERDVDVLYSDVPIGLLRMSGLKNRFYRGPLTDEEWQAPEEFKERMVFVKDAKTLLARLKKGTGKRKIGAALIPLDVLGPLEGENMRSGLLELWLSPLYPGPVFAARMDLSKLQKLQFTSAMIAAAEDFAKKEQLGIGGFKPATHETFEPLEEFIKKPEEP